MVYAEDMDIRALQAKLAAQEARLNDLQSKMGSGSAETPASVISMRKNAKVTIGGSLDTRYYYQTSKIKQDKGIANSNGGATGFVTTYDGKRGNLYMDTAKLNAKIDVNEHMDAYLQIDLHDGARQSVGMAQNYWVRWKNICNSGFGVLVGRDGVKFGTGKPIGTIDAFYQDYGPHTFFGQGDNAAADGAGRATDNGEGMFAHNNMRPTHYGVGTSRTLQITPYWESQDGKFKAELSLMSRIDSRGNTGLVTDTGVDNMDVANHTGNAEVYNRSINYGLGTASLRLTWKPIEDLTLTVSAMNLRSNYNSFLAYRGSENTNFSPNTNGRGHRFEKNNTLFHAGFVYNPAVLCKRLTLWGTFVQEYNAGWIDDLDVWSTNFGIAYALTDKLKVFAQGDYMKSDNGWGVDWAEASGWRSYIGANYVLGGGADLEVGWVHDDFDYENSHGRKHTEFKADLIYAKLGFAF